MCEAMQGKLVPGAGEVCPQRPQGTHHTWRASTHSVRAHAPHMASINPFGESARTTHGKHQPVQ